MKKNISFLFTVLLITGITFYFWLHTNSNNDSYTAASPTTITKCLEVMRQISSANSCDKKWVVFEANSNTCWNKEIEINPEIGASELYNNLLFEIGRCFVQKNKEYEKAIKVLEFGFKKEDWQYSDMLHEYPAHFYISSFLEPLLPPQNKICNKPNEIEEKLRAFSKSKNFEILASLIYSENSLEYFVPSSDVGGPTSFSAWSESEKQKKDLQYSFDRKIGANCFKLNVQNDPDQRTWRVFCFESRGTDCVYWTTISGEKEALFYESDFKDK